VREVARARRLTYGYGLLAAFGLGHFLLGLPIQLSDSFGNMLKLSVSWPELLYGEFTQQAYLRPGLWAGLKVVYDAAAGNYHAWYRGVHAAQAVLLVLLFLALIRPRTMRDAALVPLGLAVLFGMHTFAGTVREAFPVNTFMTILLCCFAAACLTVARYRWWNDVLVALLFVAAALTVESGLLVFVVVMAGAIGGARGVSRPGLAALAALFAGYFVLRFVWLDIGSPGLIERASGFGFGILEPAELQARFGDNPFGFYLYNIATSGLSVLLSEPTGGVFRAVDAMSRGALTPGTAMILLSSLGATALIVSFIWTRRDRWIARRLERDDQIVLMFVAVLGANAVISYPYTRDMIMSPAGAFFAAATFVAARAALARLPERLPIGAAALMVTGCLVVSTGWAIRALGIHLTLRAAAHVERNDWAYAESTFREEGVTLTARDRVLFDALRDDALVVHRAPPGLTIPFWPVLGFE
jgi:hypothetical protein